MKLFLALLLVLSSVPAHAIHETVYAAQAADTANNTLLANPPLPMLRYSPGKWKLGLAPYYFTAKQDYTDNSPSGEFVVGGKYSGWGLGGSASWAFAERWGLFAMGVGSNISARDLFYNGAPSNPNANDLRVEGASASAITLGGGLVYQFFGASERGFVLPVFAGLMFKKYAYAHRVIENRSNGALNADYDVEGGGVVPGVLVGAQAGIDIGEKWQLNPFFILGVLADSEMDVKVKTVRFNAFPNDSNQGLNRLQNGEKPEAESEFAGFGMNLLYRPWGVAVNLTSSFMPSVGSDGNLKTAMFSVSKSFGPGR